MTRDDIPQILLNACARILRPLITILLRYGVSYAAFSELAKGLYFDVAKTKFAIPGKRQTSSRISTMTGLSRKEVARLEALPNTPAILDTSGINRAARVISGWIQDADFSRDGLPQDLDFDGIDNSFSALVKRYSGDITARTIADELSRIGAIAVTDGGKIRLQSRAYIVNSSETEKLTLLGNDVADLIETFDHNLCFPEQPRLQRKVAYNYIPLRAVPELQAQLTEISQSGLESMSAILNAKAVNKADAGDSAGYVRIGIGIYYFEGPHS